MKSDEKAHQTSFKIDDTIPNKDKFSRDEVSETLYRQSLQTALSCKRSNSAVVNVREKARKGQVNYREMTVRESLDEVSKRTSWSKSSYAKGTETKHIGRPGLLDMPPSVFR
jgi:hypothetical protein